MAQARDQWTTRTGFILAAVGSAIGLGNIWRYPYVVYDNGGGAFLLPYFFALLTAGIPILLLEYSLGHKYRGSGPLSFRRLSKKWEWLGWWQSLIAFLISGYYMVILGWALSYTYYSFGTQWGSETQTFFLEKYLGAADFGSFTPQLKVLIPVVLLWAFVYYVMRQQAHRGIEKLARILMPLLVIMLVIITIRGVTLPGAAEGLNTLFTPDFTALADPQVWVAAYGQVFFSLSVGFATMITYASYLNKKEDLANSGLVAAFANSGFEFMAAIGIFGALGFLAAQSGVGVDEVVNQGVILAFVIFPQIINELPFLNSFFGVTFFGALVFAGLTSIVSLLEPAISAIRDKTGAARTTVVNWIVGLAALMSVLYATDGGLNYLDTIDHYLNSYGLLIAATLMAVATAWTTRKVGELQSHINQVSDVHIGKWWVICVSVVTPVMLIIMTGLNIRTEWLVPYSGYPMPWLIGMGWGALVAVLIAAVILQSKEWKVNTGQAEQQEKEGA
ncbi:NSS family neurotransmitter:Na+ symporter [Melghirimyces profundicolus]|uniref:NSS family neurotransmitter:Na+ symporter n=1 Tax=Melghirimyces profundicolus TaxID=1242148 RepID=A0A2T6BSK4_9BACL|nr:sodium-dependent transporter [Melghirimyces profundicolus]PTX59071.1 NSS family neurotransmitter:Na+ symporter [Melghirimyces profundicolus]